MLNIFPTAVMKEVTVTVMILSATAFFMQQGCPAANG